jgi:hypothetical protein
VRRDELPPGLEHLPICTHRELPVPYIAERDEATGVANFGVLDPARHDACYEGRLCAMCGLPMGGEVALYGDLVSLEPGGFYTEPPVHEACIVLALGGLCPFISRAAVPRRPVGDDPTVNLLGDLASLAQVGRAGGPAKRPAAVAIARDYRKGLHLGGSSGPMPVYLPAGLVRVRYYGWVDGRAAEVSAEQAAADLALWEVRESQRTRPPQVAADGPQTGARASVRPAARRHQPVRQTRSQRRGRR